MQTLYTIEVPQKGEYKIAAATDELAMTRLREQLHDEAEMGEALIQLTPGMIIARESHADMDEFYARYRLIKNPANEGSGEPHECMFETYGSELAFVREQPRELIWTLIEMDGISWIVPGAHFVNRLGYFVTTEPCDDHDLSYLYG